MWASSLQTALTKFLCPLSVFCTVKVSWARGKGVGVSPRFERFESRTAPISRILGQKGLKHTCVRLPSASSGQKGSSQRWPNIKLHFAELFPKSSFQLSSLLILFDIKCASWYFSIQCLAKAFQTCDRSASWQAQVAQNVRHLQPFWTNFVAPQGHLQVFLLLSNFCEHLTGSHRLTLHHQSLHHTTPIALAASLPIKVHPKPMNFRPRMSCSCSFTSCHKQSRIDRRCFWHRERTGAM